MIKKVLFMLLLSVLVISSFIPAFGFNEGSSILTDKKTESTSEFMVTITRPEGDESTFKSSYVICGKSASSDVKVEDIRVELYIYDEETGKYVDFKNNDGTSYWDIGVAGIFMKEVILPDKGANMVRIVAYNKNNAEKKEELTPGTDLQLNNYTITVLDKGLKDSIKNGLFRVTDMFNTIFSVKFGSR